MYLFKINVVFTLNIITHIYQITAIILFYPNDILRANTLHFNALAPSHFQRNLLDLSHVWMGTEIRWQQDDLKVSLTWESYKQGQAIFSPLT